VDCFMEGGLPPTFPFIKLNFDGVSHRNLGKHAFHGSTHTDVLMRCFAYNNKESTKNCAKLVAI